MFQLAILSLHCLKINALVEMGRNNNIVSVFAKHRNTCTVRIDGTVTR